MDILGIGPLEILVILILVLIVMGPKDIVKSSKVVGKLLRQVMTSPTFRLVQDTSREIRNLPYRLARDAGLEELQSDLKNISDINKISPHPDSETSPGLGSWENKATAERSPGGQNGMMADAPAGAEGPPASASEDLPTQTEESSTG